MSTCKRTQGFAQNGNPLYVGQGLKGHSGVDDTCGYGSKIYALKRGLVYKILDATHPASDGSGYWAVFMLCQEPDGKWIEWQIGHCSKIYVKPGDLVEPWDFIAEEGNRGGVYYNGIRITKAMQDAGDIRGAHRHYNKKPLTPLTEEERDHFRGAYITEFSTTFPPILYQKDGKYFGVTEYYNGYNGSVDCAKDIEEGRKLVDAHFAQPAVIATTTPTAIAEAREQLQLSVIKKMLDAIGAFLSQFRRR